MRLAVACLVVGIALGYAGRMYQTRLHGTVAARVDTVKVLVASADSAEAVRRDFDAPAKHLIAHLRDAAGMAQFHAKRDSLTADSTRKVLDTAIVSLTALRVAFQRLDSLRQRQIANERAAADSLQLALSHATERWMAADSAARSLTGALHTALRQVEIIAHATHRCGIGAAGPVGLDQHGFSLGAAFGFACRL